MKKIIYIIFMLLCFNNSDAQTTQIDHPIPNINIDTTSITEFCYDGGFESGNQIAWNNWHAAFGTISGNSASVNILNTNYSYEWGIKSTGSSLAEIQNQTSACSHYFSCYKNDLNTDNNTYTNASDYVQKNQIHHNVVSTGFDPIVTILSKTHSGSYSLRLGNAASNNGFEYIEKKFVVDASNSIFSFWYASVMSNPQHGIGQDQYFGVNIYDASGTTLIQKTNTVGGVTVNVGSGTNTCYSSDAFSLLFPRNKFCDPTISLTGGVKYRDWSFVSLDLSTQIGKTVAIRLWTRDCSHCGDFAYVYLDDFCTQPNSSNPTGSIVLGEKDTCGTGKICVNYSLPHNASLTGSTQLFLNIYQNGTLITTLNSGITWLNSGTSYCFAITPGLLATLSADPHFDYSVKADFKIGSVPLGSQYIGLINSGQDGIINNDYAISCPRQCICGQWGSTGYTLNQKDYKFNCNNGGTTVIQANQGDIISIQPNYICNGGTVAAPCNATYTYDVYFPNGGVLHRITDITNAKLDSCGLTRVVMTPYCDGKPCLPCEFSINVNCCNCNPNLSAMLSWQTANGSDSLNLNCGETYTNRLDCFKDYLISVKNPCGANCKPDEVITTITYPNGTTSTSTSVFGTTLSTGSLTGTFTVSIKVKCNGVWCKECKITFIQTKPCPPPCDNCKDKVQATFNSSASNVSVQNFPGSSTLNTSLLLNGGSDTYTQLRVNVLDIQVSSDNPACLQCYNTPNQWGSILGGSLSIMGFTSASSTYGTIPTSNPFNNSREIVFTAATATAIPASSSINLNMQIPGVNPISCCCIKIKLFLKITYRNNKCEECSKVVMVDLNECPGANGTAGTYTFNQNGGKREYKIASPNNDANKSVNFSSEVINKDKK